MGERQWEPEKGFPRVFRPFVLWGFSGVGERDDGMTKGF